jgi:hypothetical protein
MFVHHIRLKKSLDYHCASSSSFCGGGEIPPSALQPLQAYYTNPAFSSPVHLQRRSISDGVRDLY